MFGFPFNKVVALPTVLVIGKVENLTSDEKENAISNKELHDFILKYTAKEIALLWNALADPAINIEQLRILQWETRAMLKLRNFFWQKDKKD